MRTKFIIFLILILHLGFKAQDVDTLETSKRDYSSYNSSIGIGFLNFGSFISALYQRKIIKNISFRVNIGDNSFFNGNANGISICIVPEYKLLKFKKHYLSLNSGVVYSTAFNSELKNVRAVNNSNIDKFGIGGPTISYRNHFSFVSALNLNFNLRNNVYLETSLCYYFYKEYTNVTLPYYSRTKENRGLIPSLSLKFSI